MGVSPLKSADGTNGEQVGLDISGQGVVSVPGRMSSPPHVQLRKASSSRESRDSPATSYDESAEVAVATFCKCVDLSEYPFLREFCHVLKKFAGMIDTPAQVYFILFVYVSVALSYWRYQHNPNTSSAGYIFAMFSCALLIEHSLLWGFARVYSGYTKQTPFAGKMSGASALKVELAGATVCLLCAFLTMFFNSRYFGGSCVDTVCVYPVLAYRSVLNATIMMIAISIFLIILCGCLLLELRRPPKHGKQASDISASSQ